MSLTVFAGVHAMDSIASIEVQDVRTLRYESFVDREFKKFESDLESAQQKWASLKHEKELYGALTSIQQKRIDWLARWYAIKSKNINGSESNNQFNDDKTAIVDDGKKSFFDTPHAPKDLRSEAIRMISSEDIAKIEDKKKILVEMAAEEPNGPAIKLLKYLYDDDIKKEAKKPVQTKQDFVPAGCPWDPAGGYSPTVKQESKSVGHTCKPPYCDCY